MVRYPFFASEISEAGRGEGQGPHFEQGRVSKLQVNLDS